MTLLHRLAFLIALVPTLIFAQAEPNRPKYQAIRADEDWSVMRGHYGHTEDVFDDLKYIEWTESGGAWVSLGGQARLRGETWENFAFTPSADDSFLLTRLRLHADVHYYDRFRIFAEVKSALSTDRDLPGGRRGMDVDELGLLNGFFDIFIPYSDDAKSVLRLGRQEVLFGKQRFFSPLDWANARRTTDGISFVTDYKDWKVSAWWVRPVSVRKYDFNVSSSADRTAGLYATGPINPSMKIDLYWFNRYRDSATYNSVSAKEKRQTIGTRIFGKIEDTSFDYDAEAAYQFGDFGNQDICAWMLSGDLGYRFADVMFSPRIFFGYDYASGGKASGSKMKTFSQILPLGHAYLGWMDIVGRQNIIDYRPGIDLQLMDELKLCTHLHFFHRASSSDALYNPGDGIVRASGASTSKEIGQELDFLLKYKLSRHWMFLLGYSYFFTGDFVKETTPAASKDVSFGYISAQMTF